MRTDLRRAALCGMLLVAAVGCSGPDRDPPGPEYRPTSTIKEIMDSIVDPSADFVWDSVEVVATLQGTEEHAPRTDDDWKAVRRHAVSLVEATNLLLMPGRRIAHPGEKADDPKIDLPPEAIQTLVDQDWPAWVRLAHGLHDAATQTLRAVDARDVQQLLSAGEVLDNACETCHKKYWYPDSVQAQPPSSGSPRQPERP